MLAIYLVCFLFTYLFAFFHGQASISWADRKLSLLWFLVDVSWMKSFIANDDVSSSTYSLGSYAVNVAKWLCNHFLEINVTSEESKFCSTFHWKSLTDNYLAIPTTYKALSGSVLGASQKKSIHFSFLLLDTCGFSCFYHAGVCVLNLNFYFYCF